MNFLKYIDLGIAVVETVTQFQLLLAPKVSITGAQITTAIQPTVTAVQIAFNVTVPTQLVTYISNAAATAIDMYVIGKVK